MIVECVYKCGDRFERRMIQDHELDDCPRRPMEVQMSRLARKFEASLRANEKKLNDVIAENKAEVEAIHAENQSVKVENARLTKRITELEKKQEGTEQKARQIEEKHDNLERELDTRIVPAPVPPFYFSITNYDHYRKVGYKWRSPSFYSHPGGYKLYCAVYANGYGGGEGTHLSLFVFIMRGEYDDQLKWPFNGTVTIAMFNWGNKEWDYSTNIKLDDSVSINDRRRAVDCITGGGHGYSMWISFKELAEKYLLEGVIRFKVTKVEVK